MISLGFTHELNQNYDKAYEWYRKAINKGSQEAAYYLAQGYHYGRGVKENWEVAARLYQQSGPFGTTALGNYYRRNHDSYTAYALYKQGCDLGSLTSCGKLDEMDESGFKALSAQ